MHIAWGDVFMVLVVGLVAGAGVVAVFSLGVDGLSIRLGGGSRRTTGTILAVVCFAVCAATVLYGLYIAIPVLHKL